MKALGSLALVVGIILLVYGIATGSATAWVILVALILVAVFAIVISVSNENNEKRQAEIEDRNNESINQSNFESLSKLYPIIKEQAGVSPKSKRIVISGGVNEYAYDMDCYVWVANKRLNFFPVMPISGSSCRYESKLERKYYVKVSIALVDVQYFAVEGEVYREQKVTGGGGGGYSVGGAIVGALIAGETGAIIGSRKEAEPVKTETVVHDTRKTVLQYIKYGEKATIYFGDGAYETLNSVIPLKEKSVANSVRVQAALESAREGSQNESAADQIRDFARLRDEGLITEEEFAQKKKQILGL